MKIQFKITKMTCASCALINEKSLLKAKGVASAQVDFKSGLAAVEFNEKIISQKQIKQIITKNGYGII